MNPIRRRRLSGEAFSPLQLPGLRLWLDANQANGTAGSALATWPDKSGNGFDATQGTGANQPTFNSGPNRVTFAGSHWMDGAFALLGAGDVPLTLFVVANLGNVTDVCLWAYGGAWTTRLTIGLITVTGAIYGANISNDRSTANGVITTGTAQVQTLRVLGGAFSASNPEFYKNGALQASTQGTGTSAPNLGTTKYRIGSNYFGTQGEFVTGDYHELLVYNSALPAGQRQAVEGYLRRKKWSTA